MKILNIHIFFFILIFFTFFTSCKSDCFTYVNRASIYAVVTEKNTEQVASVDGWYRSEFQKDKLNFSIEFDHSVDVNGNCNWVWGNFPIPTSIELRSNRELIIDSDTIYSYQNLIEYFNIEKYEDEGQWITFLLTQKQENEITFLDEYYSFDFQIDSDDGSKMRDSCLVKIIN